MLAGSAAAFAQECRCREVRHGLTRGVRSALGLLPVLLPTQRRLVEDSVGVAAGLGAAGEGGVGVEEGVTVPQEEAEARILERLLLVQRPVQRGRLGCLQLGPVAVVDLQGGLRLVDGGVEVVVEVAPEGREEGERPASLRLVARHLGVGSTGDGGEGGLSGAEVRPEPVGDFVTAGGAGRTAPVPGRVEHEVVDHHAAGGRRRGRAGL